MRGVVRVLVSLLLLAVLGCGREPPVGPPPVDPVDPGPVIPLVDLRADVNRNGTVDLDDPSEDEGEDSWSSERGAIFLANLDDDSGRCPFSWASAELSDVALAQCHDAADDIVNGAADVADLALLRTVPWPGAPSSVVGTLSVPGVASSQVRLFRKTASGAFQKFVPSTDRLSAAELRQGVELALEATDIVRDEALWDGFADVVLGVTWTGAPAEPPSDTVRLRVAPVVTYHHLLPAQTVFVTDKSPATQEDLDSSRLFQEALAPVVTGARVPEPLQRPRMQDQWMQDHFEPAFMSRPSAGGRQHVMRVLLRSPFIWSSQTPDSPLREGGRVAFQLRGPDLAVVQQYDLLSASHGSGVAQTLNSLGNVETLPPHEKDGVRYPLGRLLIGSIPTTRPDPSFTRMLEAQRMQPPVLLDTSWLYVGHVDETVSFVPSSRSPRGWVVLVADPVLARAMLEQAQAQGHGDAKLFTGKTWGRRLQRAPAEVSISQVLADADVMNESALSALEVDAQLAVLREQLGLTEDDIVRVPFLHQRVYTRSAAYQPATVNLLVLSRTDVAAPDPQGPLIDGRDPFKTYLEQALAPHGLTVHWLDDWNLYHRHIGNVHCATNTVRQTPEVKWWETGR